MRALLSLLVLLTAALLLGGCSWHYTYDHGHGYHGGHHGYHGGHHVKHHGHASHRRHFRKHHYGHHGSYCD